MTVRPTPSPRVAANSFSAVADFLRLERIRVGMERVGDRMIGLPFGFLVFAVGVGVTAPV